MDDDHVVIHALDIVLQLSSNSLSLIVFSIWFLAISNSFQFMKRFFVMESLDDKYS